MSTYNDEILKKYENLPADVKEALSGMPLDDKINRIAEDNHLHVDQAGFLQSLIEQVLIGITHPKEFQGKLVFLLEITPEVAKNITEQANTLIFLPLRQSLQQIHQLREASELTTALTGKEGTPEVHEILSAISSPTGTSTPAPVAPAQPEYKPPYVPYTPTATTPPVTPTPAVSSSVTTPVVNKIPEVPPAKIPFVAVPGKPAMSAPAAQPSIPMTPAIPSPVSPIISIPEQKLAGTVRTAPVVTVDEKHTAVSFIPDDHKARINSDPYREKI